MDDPEKVREQLKMFGQNLRRARVSRKFTQDALSEKANLHIRVLQKMEAGETNVLVTTAMRLQHVLGCPWQELFSSPPPSHKKD